MHLLVLVLPTICLVLSSRFSLLTAAPCLMLLMGQLMCPRVLVTGEVGAVELKLLVKIEDVEVESIQHCFMGIPEDWNCLHTVGTVGPIFNYVIT